MRRSISTRLCGTFSATTASGAPPPTTLLSITSPTATTRCRPGSLNAKRRRKRRASADLDPSGDNQRIILAVCFVAPRERDCEGIGVGGEEGRVPNVEATPGLQIQAEGNVQLKSRFQTPLSREPRCQRGVNHIQR